MKVYILVFTVWTTTKTRTHTTQTMLMIKFSLKISHVPYSNHVGVLNIR